MVAARSSRSAVVSADANSTRCAFGQRVDQAPRHLLGPIVQPAPFAPTFRRQADDALAAVRRIPSDGHELVLLELTEQPAEVTGVETEPAPQLAHARPSGADLEQQARRAEGTAGTEVRLVEQADALRVAAVEPAQNGDLIHDR